jgi:hypothetical protein
VQSGIQSYADSAKRVDGIRIRFGSVFEHEKRFQVEACLIAVLHNNDCQLISSCSQLLHLRNAFSMSGALHYLTLVADIRVTCGTTLNSHANPKFFSPSLRHNVL